MRNLKIPGAVSVCVLTLVSIALAASAVQRKLAHGASFPGSRYVLLCHVRNGPHGDHKRLMQILGHQAGLLSLIGGDRGVSGVAAPRDKLPRARRLMRKLARKYGLDVTFGP